MITTLAALEIVVATYVVAFITGFTFGRSVESAKLNGLIQFIAESNCRMARLLSSRRRPEIHREEEDAADWWKRDGGKPPAD